MGGQIVEVLIPKIQSEDGYQWVVSPRAGIDTTYETAEGSIKPLTGDAKIWGYLDYPYTIRQCLSIYLFPILKSWQTYPYPYLGITWVSRVLSLTSSCNK